MKYFIDTEFIEGFHKPLFGKRRHFIDLISIGIVCEDGREYYAISNEFDPKDADKWVQGNVIMKLEGIEDYFHIWKSNKEIKQDIIEFICPYEKASEFAGVGSIDSGMEGYLQMNPPKFYAYYADYDWVLFCSLFGRMIDLPKGFPMYCRDLKQNIDEYIDSITTEKNPRSANYLTKETALEQLKKRFDYPKQTNEHNALADAKWNYELYKFLQTI